MNEYDRIMKPIERRRAIRQKLYNLFMAFLWLAGIAVGIWLWAVFRH